MVVNPFLPVHKWKVAKALATTSQKKTSKTPSLDFPCWSVNWTRKHSHCIDTKPVSLWNAKPRTAMLAYLQHCNDAYWSKWQCRSSSMQEILLWSLFICPPAWNASVVCAPIPAYNHYWLCYCTTTANSPWPRALQLWFLSSHTY